MIQKGYVTKRQSPDDKREYHLYVTQKYIDYYNVSYRYLSTVMDRIKQRFPRRMWPSWRRCWTSSPMS